jgi:hypothetical protein
LSWIGLDQVGSCWTLRRTSTLASISTPVPGTHPSQIYDGLIFISIGDDEMSNLRMICDDIFFGEENRAGMVTWKARVKPVNIGDAKYRPQNEVEYLLIYQKDYAEGLFRPLFTGSKRSYPFEKEGRRYRLATILKSNRGVNYRTTMSFEENLFIEGDNLEVLKLLQKAYFGRIKMIYIDPPYNTGREFIYPDKYAETLETYLSYTGQVDASGRKFSTSTEAAGRYHSRWLSMMFPRLYLARNKLTDSSRTGLSVATLGCWMIFMHSALPGQLRPKRSLLGSTHSPMTRLS